MGELPLFGLAANIVVEEWGAGTELESVKRWDTITFWIAAEDEQQARRILLERHPEAEDIKIKRVSGVTMGNKPGFIVMMHEDDYWELTS